MKILVTGGNGFIGQHLIQSLNNHTILNLDKKNGYDLTNFSKINKIIKQFNPDVIYHLAALFKGSKEELFKLNVDTTKNLLDNSPYKKFIFLSTSELYHGNNPPFHENMPLSYRSLYSENKLLAENLCKEKIKEGKNIIIVRPSVVYGPNQKNHQFIPSLINACLNKKEFNMTKGEQTRDFIFIKDLTNLLTNLLTEENVNREIINAGSGNSITIKELTNQILNLTLSDTKINFGALPYRKNEIMEHAYDISKTKKLLNWKPSTNLNQGLKQTIKSNFTKTFKT